MVSIGEAQLRRHQPHAFYSVSGPMTRVELRQPGMRVQPVIRCCETELMEDEAAGHDSDCPRRESVT